MKFSTTLRMCSFWIWQSRGMFAECCAECRGIQCGDALSNCFGLSCDQCCCVKTSFICQNCMETSCPSRKVYCDWQLRYDHVIHCSVPYCTIIDIGLLLATFSAWIPLKKVGRAVSSCIPCAGGYTRFHASVHPAARDAFNLYRFKRSLICRVLFITLLILYLYNTILFSY